MTHKKEGSEKVVETYSGEWFIARLKNCHNTQRIGTRSSVFHQDNRYLRAVYNTKIPGTTFREYTELRKAFRRMVEDAIYSTEVLLENSSIALALVTRISIMGDGRVMITLLTGENKYMYTRNGSGREPMLVNSQKDINLTRPSVEEYFSYNSVAFPNVSRMISCFKQIHGGLRPVYVAASILKFLHLSATELQELLREYRQLYRDCPYQLCSAKYRGGKSL